MQDRGIVSAPEQLIRSSQENRRMPDIIVKYSGLRLHVEGEVGDTSNAREKARASARSRVEEGIAHIALAVIYPAYLRHVDFPEVNAELAGCMLELCVVSEFGETPFIEIDVDHIESILRYIFDQLVREDIVHAAVAHIDSGISEFSEEIIQMSGAIGRISSLLGIKELPGQDK